MFGGPRVGGEKYAAEEGVAFLQEMPVLRKRRKLFDSIYLRRKK
jgi:hypothetical protein